MRMFKPLSMVVAGVLLSGCGGNGAVFRGFVSERQCAGDCEITVAVGSGCVFQKSAIETMVLTGNRGERKLTWTIAEGSPYEFSREFDYKGPIYIRGDSRDPATDPGSRIRNTTVSNNRKVLIVTFDKKNAGSSPGTELTYYLNFLDATTPHTKTWCEIDPWIVDR